MSELKSRLKGLIPLLIIISMLFACAKKNDVISPSETTALSVDYFITKKPEPNDKSKLVNIINSADNPEVKNKAKILLGGYYYKQGEYENSLINLQEIDATNNQRLNNAAYVWLASLYKFFGNESKMDDTIRKIKNPGEISKYIMSKTCEKGKAYCIKREDIAAIKEKKKAKQKIVEKEKAEQLREKEKKKDAEKEKYRKEKLKILALNGNFDNPAFKGMLLAASQDNKTEIISRDNVSGNSTTVDVENLNFITEKGEISFKINYKKAIDELLYDTDFSKCEEIAIGVNDKFVNAGEYTKRRLMKFHDNITVSNYETEDFKHLYIKPDNETVTTRCFVGIGRENSMTSFVPLVRFVSPDKEGTEIYIVTDIYTGKYKNKNFIDYFSDVNIYTYIDTVYDTQSREFMDKYVKIYGTQPSYKAFIGYDVVQHFENKFLKNKENAYVTSIKDIRPPVVERYVHKLRIDDNYKTRFLFMPKGKQIPLQSIPAE